MAIKEGTTPLPYQREVDIATHAVRIAAKLSQHIINNTDKGVIHKDDLTPVTLADFAIQALLAATIKHHFPEDQIVGEEDSSQLRGDLLLLEHIYELLRWVGGYGDDEDAEAARADFPADCRVPGSREHMCDLIDECGTSKPGACGRTWVFDPIDGTKNYVKGNLYAINVALLVDGKQTVSVVGCPNMSVAPVVPLSDSHVGGKGSTVFAIKDHGAFVRRMDGEGEVVKLARQDENIKFDDIKFVSSTTVNSTLPGVNEEIAKRINPTTATEYPTVDLLPWVLRWIALARGLGNTTVWVYKNKNRRGKIWDHAGCMLIYEETGGVITDIHGKAIDLVAGRQMVGNFSFVGAPAHLHDKVLKTVQTVLEDLGHGALLRDSVSS